jgi:hypothetical protein
LAGKLVPHVISGVPPKNSPLQGNNMRTAVAGALKASLFDVFAFPGVIFAPAGAVLRDDNATLRDDNATLRDDNATLRDDNATLRDDNATLRDDNAALRDDNAVFATRNAALPVANVTKLTVAGKFATRGANYFSVAGGSKPVKSRFFDDFSL